jgi:hypothetical protein
MSALREAAQQALEALEEYAPQHGNPDDMDAAIAALRTALAQQEPLAGMSEMNRTIAYCAAAKLRELGYEWDGKAWTALAQEGQEPVAWIDEESIAWLAEHPRGIIITRLVKQRSPERQMAMYAAPPRREWQSLSDEEVKTAIGASEDFWAKSQLWIKSIASAVEAALKEKNI